MTTAGEAAALFGADDSAADLFSLGAETDQANGSDPFAGEDIHSATDLFGSAAPEDSVFASQNETSGQQSYEHTDSTWNAPTAQYTPNNHVDATIHARGYASTYAPQPALQAYSSQQGSWAGYEPQQYNPPVNGSYSGSSHSSSGQYATYNPSNAYVPPAPASASAYGSYAPTTRESYATTTNVSAQAAYDPYKSLHVQQPSYGSTVPNASVYDPYKPSQPAVQPSSNHGSTSGQYTYPQATATTSVLVPSADPPPSRPAVTADAFRPKTSNAYDPPLPPPKPIARRTPAPAWPAPGISPVQTPYALPTSPPMRGPASAGLPPPPQRPPSMPPPPPRSRSTVSDYAPPPSSHPSRNYVSPPPPRAAPPNTFSPPPPSLRTTVSPPPRTPPVRQYTPIQQTGHAYAPDSSARGYSPAPRDVPQAGTSAPPAVYGVNAGQKSLVPPKPIYDVPNEHDTPAPITHTVGDNAGLPTISAAEEVDDPEGGVFEGDDFWDKEEQEVAQNYGTTGATESEADVPSALGQAETPLPHEPIAVNPTPDADEEASGSPLVTHSPEETWSEPPAPVSEPAAAPTTLHDTKSSPESTYDPYNPHRAAVNQPPSRTQTPERAISPGNASIRSWSSSQRYSLDQERSPAPAGPYAPPTRQSTKDSVVAAVYDPYAPSTAQRAASPSTFSVRSVGSTHSQPPRDPYAPVTASGASSIRNRSESNGSLLAYGATTGEDPYAPSRHRQSSVESSSYRSFSALQQGYADSSANMSTGPSQVVTLSAPAHAPYAPSPSLLGTNDPLGRTSVRIPVISFGFGGKLVTCFHGTSALNTGFDVAMSSRASSVVHIRPLHTAIPQSALETSSAAFPGPLFSDPASQATTLVRTGAATQTKNKKAKVVQYLEERAEEISQGLGYLHHGSVEGFRAEAKLVMIKLLKTMVENDGRLSGSPQIESAVRAALLPDLESSPDSPTEGLHVPALASSSYPGHGSITMSDDTVVATNTLRSSQLNRIQRHLLRGDRRAAYQYAADERLWAHAMVIASSIDKEAWKEVVTEFLRAELSATGAAPLDAKGAQTNGREPLKVAYSLFAGQGPASVQELLPPRPLASMQSLQSLQVLPTAASGTTTPLSASFPPTLPPLQLSKDILAKWKETAGMILSGAMSTESSSALTALGDQLVANGWVEAGHVCYLLSPQTSPMGGAGLPSGRVVLYGSPNPQLTPNFWKDSDPIIFSEVVEFALSLAAPVKGQEAFPGIPHLQPYRFIRAAYLAELGHMDLANRYCDAISNSLTRPSPYLNAVFGEQLKGLVDRLTAAPVTDKTGSWKMAKPSLDKIGGWLERGFTSFIAGDSDSPKPVEANGKEPTFGGPFTHFSSISTVASEASSTISSPQMSTTNLTEIPAAPPFRTGSAMALRPPSGSANQIARASSAIDYLRRKPSPVPRMSSASAMSSSFGDLPSRGQDQSPYGYPYGQPDVTPRADRGSLLSDVGAEQEGSLETPSGPQTASWWSDAPTPTASSFSHPEPSNGATGGFVSLMDNNSYAPGPTQRTQSSSSYLDDVDEEDDLGLGNSSRRAKAKAEAPQEQAQAKPAAEAKKSESSPSEADKPAGSSGGWLSRLWKRGDTPGPVKANLGEQSAFYYDKELKRWVNKNAGAEAAAPSAPPPPPRAQTASPGMSMPRSQGAPSPGPPPARPATASIDLTDGPPKKPPMRIRSNLVPSEVASAPTTPAPPRTPSSSMDPPGLDGLPPAGARAKAGAKRNARSRYVDVFQQE